MIKTIEALPKEDQKVMYDSIAYVTLLIAGADGKIDPKELEWSEKITEIRAFSFHEEWQPFYDTVHQTLHGRLEELMEELPDSRVSRQEELVNRLSKLNDILPKIDQVYARHFYDGLKTFADRIARADGGVLGWLSISPEEAKVVELPMIKRID